MSCSRFGTLASAGISFYICLVLSSAMGGPGISREGRGFWLLQGRADQRAGDLLLGKLALAYLPFPTIGALFVLFLSMLAAAARRPSSLRSLALVLLGGLGATSITLGMGAAFPKLNWENPRQQTTFRAGCLAPILYMLYIAVAAAAVFGLPVLALLIGAGWAVWLTAAGWLIVVALTAAVVWGSLAFGAARLDQLEVS